ncbi:LacI family DNA-binding transcriptional regulator [Nakamurella deserti]|uniref:LacI family DNA-binding transcriptional regulator n=1 Tax=Nakamurella deserti TaxID=2164074 RepID=UPI0014788B70|nr:LacI family DNA-binding transcriptional regulator [Nakamurella deserti]
MAVKATDVAARAGVSIATVSLVVNGKGAGRVSADTRTRVEQAVRELGYVVNPAARSLVTGTHGRIALLTDDLVNPFIAAIASGVSTASGADTALLLATGSRPDHATLASMGVDGMLVHRDEPDGQAVGGGPVPVVVLDEPGVPGGPTGVHFDVGRGAAALGAHLAGIGHRRVAYVDSARSRTSFTLRREVFAAAFGGEVSTTGCGLDLALARELTTDALAGWRRSGITAIVTATDVQAYGVLAALAAVGLSVPHDFSVASFDDNALSSITAPPLTTVAMDAAELGRRAVTLLLEEIRGSAPAGRSVVLPSSLVIRSSTAAPREDPS